MIQQAQGNVLCKQIYKNTSDILFQRPISNLSVYHQTDLRTILSPRLFVHVGSLVLLIFVLHCTCLSKSASFFSHKAGIYEAQIKHRALTTLCFWAIDSSMVCCAFCPPFKLFVYLFAYIYNVQDFFCM